MGTVGTTKMGDTFSTLKDQLTHGGQQKKETCQPAVNAEEDQAEKEEPPSFEGWMELCRFGL